MHRYAHEFSLSRHTAFATGVVALMVSGAAFAHTGTGLWHNHFYGLLAGWGHPFTGIDHLLAMFAVGLWAGQLDGRAVWAVPAGFVVVMAAGGAAAMRGFPVPAIESGILASLIVLGLAIAAAVKGPVSFGAAGVGLFALFHGAAHGLEMPAANSAIAYSCGFLLATIILHACGVLAARAFRRSGLTLLPRLAGAGIAATGAALMIF
jgi:urease accessory protein